ncbi:MAG: hypothetical protein HN337_02490, partial [Deltaproteobacteria bacterium]|nr:hypothetical protein [Deltaproteobacteria bacterium]
PDIPVEDPKICGDGAVNQTGEDCEVNDGGEIIDGSCASTQRCEGCICVDASCNDGTLDDGELCGETGAAGCADDEVCKNCLCEKVTKEKPAEEVPEPTEIPADMPANAQAEIRTQCFVKCDSYTHDDYKDFFASLNSQYQDITGNKDQRFCQETQRAEMVCYIKNLYKAQKTTSGTEWVTNPYMITQDGGSEAIPRVKDSRVQKIKVVRNPLRIIPLAGANSQMASSLPDTSSVTGADLNLSGSYNIQGGMQPMAAENVVHGSNGQTIINDMISHMTSRVVASKLSSDYSDYITKDLTASGSSSFPSEGAESDGITVTNFTIPEDFALYSMVTDSAQEVIANLEEQGLSVEDVYVENRPTVDDVFASLKQGSDMYNVPWAVNQHYKFTVISQDAAAVAGHQTGLVAMNPSYQGGGLSAGGSCKCNLSSGDRIDYLGMLPLLLLMIIFSGSIFLVRVRMISSVRKRRNS